MLQAATLHDTYLNVVVREVNEAASLQAGVAKLSNDVQLGKRHCARVVHVLAQEVSTSKCGYVRVRRNECHARIQHGNEFAIPAHAHTRAHTRTSVKGNQGLSTKLAREQLCGALTAATAADAPTQIRAMAEASNNLEHQHTMHSCTTMLGLSRHLAACLGDQGMPHVP